MIYLTCIYHVHCMYGNTSYSIYRADPWYYMPILPLKGILVLDSFVLFWTEGGCRRENWMSYGHHYYYSTELHSRQRLVRDEAVVSIIHFITYYNIVSNRHLFCYQYVKLLQINYLKKCFIHNIGETITMINGHIIIIL